MLSGKTLGLERPDFISVQVILITLKRIGAGFVRGFRAVFFFKTVVCCILAGSWGLAESQVLGQIFQISEEMEIFFQVCVQGGRVSVYVSQSSQATLFIMKAGNGVMSDFLSLFSFD